MPASSRPHHDVVRTHGRTGAVQLASSRALARLQGHGHPFPLLGRFHQPRNTRQDRLPCHPRHRHRSPPDHHTLVALGARQEGQVVGCDIDHGTNVLPRLACPRLGRCVWKHDGHATATDSFFMHARPVYHSFLNGHFRSRGRRREGRLRQTDRQHPCRICETLSAFVPLHIPLSFLCFFQFILLFFSVIH